MAQSKNRSPKQLVERMVRNEHIFCSLLFNNSDKTLRVIDFRGGNFAAKHQYLAGVAEREGMRKIFTLTERDDMNGWQRVGFHREGNIPGYYKRSDAYIMARILDDDFGKDEIMTDDAPVRRDYIIEVKEQGLELSESRVTGVATEPVTEDEALEALEEELARRKEKSSKSKAKSKAAQTGVSKFNIGPVPPIFKQFSREVENFFFVARNKRTKALNLIGAEYQDCFSNAKVDLYFVPSNKTEMNLAYSGLMSAIDQLAETGIVSVFSVAPSGDQNLNVLYAAAGFRNTGWMHRQLKTSDGSEDLVVWTRKLV